MPRSSRACLTGTMVATQYFAAMSMDGFIAGPGNAMDWLVQLESSEGRDGRFRSFFSCIGAMAMGATTYEWALGHVYGPEPEKWQQHYGQIPCWVFSLLPRKQAMQARARKQERIRRKKGSKASLAPAWWAGVMILGTTLPQEQWSAQDVVKLYRARWQIELLFKRLKHGLQLHLLPVKLWERAQASVQLCLIVWSLQEQEAQELSELLVGRLREPEVGPLEEPAEDAAENPTWVVSHWGLACCELSTLRTLLRGSWTRQRLRDCLPALRRYLVSRQRQTRLSQETEVQQWLRQRLGLPEKEAIAA